jgi:hypothetical protein
MINLDRIVGDFAQADCPLPISIAWRVVYYRPSAYSNEAIAVGVIVEHEGSCFLDYAASVEVLEKFTDIFGAPARDELIFGLGLLNDEVRASRLGCTNDETPCEYFSLGAATPAVCENPREFARDMLRLSSSLFRQLESTSIRFQSVSQAEVVNSVKRRLVQLDPFRATALIKPATVKCGENRSFKVPICGSRTIGAPVSLITTRVTEAMTAAEAQMMRLQYAQHVLGRDSFLYVFTPPKSADIGSISGRVADGIEELQALGDSCGVQVCSSDSIDELVSNIFSNEHAEVSQRRLMQ